MSFEFYIFSYITFVLKSRIPYSKSLTWYRVARKLLHRMVRDNSEVYGIRVALW
jgi:hypothetical protein